MKTLLSDDFSVINNIFVHLTYLIAIIVVIGTNFMVLKTKIKNMSIKLIANIEHHENAGFVASIDSIKGMVVSADTFEEVVKELFISLKVQLAYTLGINASDIKEIDEAEAKAFERQIAMQKKTGKDGSDNCKKEINLTLSA